MSDEKRERLVPPRSVRLEELFARLERHPLFSNFEAAYQGLVTTLEAVEDELTGIPNDYRNWKTDGRLYPPLQDNWSPVSGWLGVIRMRTKSHVVFIAANGAIEARIARTNRTVFLKPGSDGKGVWDP